MPTIVERYIEKGWVAGLAKGRANAHMVRTEDLVEKLVEGRKNRNEDLVRALTEGEADALQRILEDRFGMLSRQRLLQIELASSERLETWLTAALDAESVQDVFRNDADE